jgi:acyl-CoA dehydrogenase
VHRTIFEAEHELFRPGFRQFVEREIQPHVEEWEAAGICERNLFAKAGRAGFLGLAAPVEVGGGATPASSPPPPVLL